ncbi:MAG: D-alanyl-D-alanine endopeptidase [Zoogloeaceae bacterium]|jgi:D-alanyl-D-alanine endopeptidase (penicillin-binding protein 7)|nr:D-alanyl-D-alanine endopeptidase [Zoogloeaceae bacterium]
MKFKLATVFAVCAAVALGALDAVAPAGAAPVKKTQVAKRKVGKVGIGKAVVKRADRRIEAHESDNLLLKSAAVVVQDQASGEILFEKNSDAVLPIASITKLMTAMVVLDAQQSLTETLTIGSEDVDMLRGSRSRLAVGTRLSREDMLLLALMASENRAASALSRHYPGGAQAFIVAMNHKATAIGLKDTHFSDPTGLTAANVSSARDLTKMVAAAAHYPLIRQLSTTSERAVTVGKREVTFRNTNTLVRNQAPGWEIAVSKTGYIREAGKCLVMQAWLNNRPVVIVLLDSLSRMARTGDATRIKHWIENASAGGHSPRAVLGRRATAG